MIVSSDYDQRDEGVVQCCAALELRTSSEKVGLDSLPFGTVDVHCWDGKSIGIAIPRGSAPAFGVMTPGKRDGGLGVPVEILGPLPWLAGLLRLQHVGDESFTLHDDTGPALALRVWRSSYTDGEYELTRPLVLGARILMRPDVLERLQEQTDGRLVLREVTEMVR